MGSTVAFVFRNGDERSTEISFAVSGILTLPHKIRAIKNIVPFSGISVTDPYHFAGHGPEIFIRKTDPDPNRNN
jgi:hypothetical protein